jgi:hypothetical protein
MDNKKVDPNIPEHIPSSCTDKLSLRLQPWRRTIVEFCAKNNKTSMTDEILKAIDLYFIQESKKNKWELLNRSKYKYVELDLISWKKNQLLEKLKQKYATPNT